MITTVLIDVDNTILDFVKCSKWAMTQAYHAQNTAYEERFYPVFKAVNDRLWHQIELGTLTKEELYTIRWPIIFKELGLSLDGAVFENDFLHYIALSAEPVQDAIELLQYLSGKYRVCIASNASRERQLKRLEKAGMLKYIDLIFTSDCIGAPKPTKAFFDGCFAQLPGISPEETILIGDSLTADIIGGVEYGLKTCWFNIEKLPIPETLKPDYIVDTLMEIKQYI